jgi:hypothetical protein
MPINTTVAKRGEMIVTSETDEIGGSGFVQVP